MQIQKKKNGKDLIRPCRYLDKRGNECVNRGGYLQPVRDAIKKAIIQYKKEILNKLQGANNRDVACLTKQLQGKNKELKKYADAIERIQDLYDLGDYSRDEFLMRKTKWENKIKETETQITLLKRQLKSQEEVTDEERLNTINYYLENIDMIEAVEDRNKLYKTILDSVVWKKVGENEPELEINFL